MLVDGFDHAYIYDQHCDRHSDHRFSRLFLFLSNPSIIRTIKRTETPDDQVDMMYDPWFAL